MKATGSTPIPLNIGRPALRALAAAGINSLEDVARTNDADLLALHGVGPKAIAILRAALKARRPRRGTNPTRGRRALGPLRSS